MSSYTYNDLSREKPDNGFKMIQYSFYPKENDKAFIMKDLNKTVNRFQSSLNKQKKQGTIQVTYRTDKAHIVLPEVIISHKKIRLETLLVMYDQPPDPENDPSIYDNRPLITEFYVIINMK